MAAVMPMTSSQPSHGQRQQDRRRRGEVVVDGQHRHDHRAQPADRADRQVDLAQQQDHDDPERDRAGGRYLQGQVRQVLRGQEVLVQRSENGRDDHQPEDDRQGPQVAAAQPDGQVAQPRPQGEAAVGGLLAGPAFPQCHGHVLSPRPLPWISPPPVMAATTAS
jgi:hypothetical protein